MILVQSFEYFTYEVSPLRGQPRLFVVRPAWGYPLQWGESYEDEWVYPLKEIQDFLDISKEDLENLGC